jgi:6-pyruvoyltetrahydropterin/6-carboxytetrahydropterin synthase
MLQLTKIFHFEMAHAICNYPGSCRHIHGHSYELHVTVASSENGDTYISSPGFEIDFKEIKHLVNDTVVRSFDHKLVLSDSYLLKNPTLISLENLVIWTAEPTAENLLIYILRTLEAVFPNNVVLNKLKLYETKDSYAEWIRPTEQRSGDPLTRIMPERNTKNNLTLMTGN